MSDVTGRFGGSPLTRRSFLLTLSAAALTAACGGGEDTPETTPSGGAAAGFPVTINGKEGKTVLQSAPSRVVSVGFLRDTDEAVSLGVVPVAVTPAINFPSGLPPWVEAKLGGKAPEQLAYEDSLPFEKIAALTPDLILATDSYGLADDFADLSAIAPTLSYEKDVAEDSWQTRATRIGQALGKGDEAAQLVKDVSDRITKVKEDNKALFAGKTFTFSLLNAEGSLATVTLAEDASAKFLSELGLTLSDKVTKLPQAGPAGRAVVSPERTDVLDADIVLFSFRNEDERKKVEGDRLFQGLDAVKRGAYVPLDVGTALSMAFPSTLSIPYALDKIVPQLVAAAGKV
ncbi:ABC transporter substrate-binding protein [Actinocorallia sp. A-T 12471]|uniref:ABC transporter substrate-binding protein n=1 Tax=Actinocorallia sp. A-T 12471 TaxID=3089813 RepID=UPI0029D2EBEE|nr:ABC transporter substrate-binding protein [Actinocorallia sp. A-T 12471]MDX6744042.1 ABC transporter substrate-binding protein [Actinocorallia sp. A-T 12471]